MTPQEFKQIWIIDGDNLTQISSDRLAGLNLNSRTIAFLTEAGLPVDAAPFLSFADNSIGNYKAIARLTAQYDFLDEEFKKWIVIGFCSDGDPIAINVEANDQIDWLDHDNFFEPGFFNSSIEAFAECLVICREFITRVNKENGEGAFIDGNFTDEQFESFKNSLLKADVNVFSENGFWKEELEMYLAMRNHYKKGA